MGQTLKNCLVGCFKTEHIMPYDLAIPLLGIHPIEMHASLPKDMYQTIHSSSMRAKCLKLHKYSQAVRMDKVGIFTQQNTEQR